MINIGNDWDERLKDEWDKPYYKELRSFLVNEYRDGTVYPPAEDIFNALRLTPYEDVKVVILGQDPYHEPGQAQGLAFSVPDGIAEPPSLVNIIKELESDNYGRISSDASGRPASDGAAANDSSIPDNGDALSPTNGYSTPDLSGVLVPWAREGVLLLNTVLTVRAHQAGSHRGRGWEQFTDRVIELLASREKPMVFILWGANAGAKKDLILRAQSEPAGQSPGAGSTAGRPAARRHLIIQAPHPSPLSAYRGFFGGRYFSRSNYFLADNGIEPVNWKI